MHGRRSKEKGRGFRKRGFAPKFTSPSFSNACHTLYIYTYLFQIILRNYWIRLSYDLKKLSRSWRVSSAEADNAEICIIVQILPCTIFVRKQNASFIESNGRTPTRYNVLNYYSFKIFLCFVLAQIPWLINKSTTIFHGLHSYRPWK